MKKAARRNALPTSFHAQSEAYGSRRKEGIRKISPQCNYHVVMKSTQFCLPENTLSSRNAEWLLKLAWQKLGEHNLSESWAAFEEAELLGADADRCSPGRWMLAMLGGDFEAAWREDDAQLRRNVATGHRLWKGEEIHDKRVIVRCLHGLGDAVQMLRYVPQLRALAKSIVVEVPPAMVALAACFDGVEEVITWGANAPLKDVDWDVQIEIMELPLCFRTTLPQLPGATKYLHLPDEVLPLRTSKRVGDKKRVGLVWAGGDWDRDRWVPFSKLLPLLDQEGTELWNLQGGTAVADAFGTSLRDAEVFCDNGLLSLAANIVSLDLIITVDTLAAHLAGALGVPAWVMLKYGADWRWLVNRNTTPWYPSLKLIRQTETRSWSELVQIIHDRLGDERCWPSWT